MPNLIDQQLEKIKSKPIGLMTHVVIGYPSLSMTRDIVMTMIDSGVDFIELQIPFTDPIADGPTIMMANDTALRNGIRLQDAFELMYLLTRTSPIPLLFMSYLNILYRFGIKNFINTVRELGASGLIIPDIPPEENDEDFWGYSANQGVYPIGIVSPNSKVDRIHKMASITKGFIYATAVMGVTGSRDQMASGIQSYVQRVKENSQLPVALGFGISTPEQVASIQGHADIAVIGSKAIDIISKAKKPLDELKSFLKSLQTENIST